jgi:WD40 repeat protein
VLADFLHDAKRFVLRNRQIVDEAPLQIYCAGLVFAPRTSIVRREFKQDFPSWICQLPRVNEKWSAEFQTLEGHSDLVSSVAFSSDGQLLASGSHDETVRLWDSATGTLKQILRSYSGPVNSVAFSPNGRLLAFGSDTVELWDRETGTLEWTLKGHSDSVQSVAFSPDGRLLASGSEDSTVQLWDPATGALKQTLEGHLGWVRSVAFSPNGQLLASSSRDGTVRLWDPVTGTLEHTLWVFPDVVLSVAFSPDGRLLASSSCYGTLLLWDPATGALEQNLEGHSKSERVLSVAFSPDSRLLASGSSDKTVRLWDTATGALEEIFSTEGIVNALEFSQDGSSLSTNLGSIKIQSNCGNPIRNISNANPEIFLQHGYWIALNGKQFLWIPPDARPSCSAINSNTLALGNASGWIPFIGFRI